jgi:hypothetical protein
MRPFDAKLGQETFDSSGLDARSLQPSVSNLEIMVRGGEGFSAPASLP